MEKNIYISKELVDNIYSDELDFLLHEEFGYDCEKHDHFYEIPRSFGRADSEPLEINKAIEILTKLKEKGSTHVQIEYNYDHIQYIFSGIKIELADEKLIEKFKKHQEKEKRCDDKISKLLKEIRELENEKNIID